MSKIEEKIRELLKAKRKSELYQDLPNCLDALITEDDQARFPEVVEEFRKEVALFSTSMRDRIEALGESKTPQPIIRETPAPQKPVEVEASISQELTEEEVGVSKQERVQFALVHRHLEHQKVRVISEGVSATVIGLRAPFIFIQYDSGEKKKVKPSELDF